MQAALFLPMTGPIAITLGLSVLFVLLGQYLSAHLPCSSPGPVGKSEAGALGLASAYGCGLVTFLSVLLLLDTLLRNARLTLAVTFGLMAAAVGLGRWLGWKRTPISREAVLALIGLFSFLFTYDLAKGLWRTWQDMPKDLTTVPMWDGLRVVVHSFRAGNITIFIHDHNYIPAIPQHIGQSLLAATASLTGFHSPQYTLLVWHAAIVAFYVVSIYAFIRPFTDSPARAVIGTTIAAAGNLTFSTEPIAAGDIGSIPVTIKSIDGAIGLATLLLFVTVVFRRLYWPTGSIKPLRDGGLVFLLTVSWCISATQNLFVAPAIVCLALLFRSVQLRQKATLLPSPRLPAVALAGVFCLAALVGSSRSGMLVPAQLRESTPIPGVKQVRIEGRKPIALHAPEVISDSGDRRNPAQSSLHPAAPATAGSRVLNFVRSCYFILFPLTGLVLLGAVTLAGPTPDTDRAFLFVSTILFTGGLAIQSTVEIYGQAWELSRFFYTGVLLGMIALAVATIQGANRLFPRSRRLPPAIAITVAASVCATPVAQMLALYWRAFLQPLLMGTLDWRQPLEFALTLTAVVGKS